MCAGPKTALEDNTLSCFHSGTVSRDDKANVRDEEEAEAKEEEEDSHTCDSS